MKNWSYKKTSEETGIPLGTLYAMVSLRRIPHIRLGNRHVLFPAEEVIRWLEKHKIELA